MKTTCGIFLISSDNLILIGLPSSCEDKNGLWSIPKGLQDHNESYIETAIREFKEETGILISSIDLVEMKAVKYTTTKKVLKPYFFKAYCKAIEFLPVCHSMVEKEGQQPFPEICEFKWVSYEEALEKLHPMQVIALKEITNHVKPLQKIEIERRWLLKKIPMLHYDVIYIKQYYSEFGRFRKTITTNSIVKYYHTVKTNISYGANIEDEKEISKKEFIKNIKSATTVLNKTRCIYKENGLTYEIDSLFNDDIEQYFIDNCDLSHYPYLTILEIELKDINQKITFNAEVYDSIIKEITGIPELSNRLLANKIK